MRRGLLVLVFMAPVVLVDCSSKSCTTRGCGETPQLWTSVNTDVLVVDLAGGRVRVCRDGRCTESPFDGNNCGRTGGFSCVPDTTQNIGVTYVDFDTAPPKDGERFEVTVLDAKGNAVGVTAGTARYTENRPNGSECEPVCIRGELDIERQ
jgi:hypothetical protein